MKKIKEKYFKNHSFLNFTYGTRLKEYLLSERRGFIYILNDAFDITKILNLNNQELPVYTVYIFDCSDILVYFTNRNIDNSLIIALQSNCSLIVYDRVLSKHLTVYNSKLYNYFSPNNKLHIDRDFNCYFVNEINQLLRFSLKDLSIKLIQDVSPNLVYIIDILDTKSEKPILIF
jgi:hypothetical protein